MLAEVMMLWYVIICSCRWLLVSISYQVRGGVKYLISVRCDIVSAGRVIAKSIASNTGSGPIEFLKK